jgi:hypothetical protein
MGATQKSSLPHKHSEITEKIIAAFYKGYNTLGFGLLLNFGTGPHFKREAFENARKAWWNQQNSLRSSA